jgi:predicted amidophosphoribosyltransferase
MDEYEDERYCSHCGRETPHLCRDGGHERDSSNDYQRCRVCEWWALGWIGKYNPPLTNYGEDV